VFGSLHLEIQGGGFFILLNMKPRRLTYVHPETEEENNLVAFINAQIKGLSVSKLAKLLGHDPEGGGGKVTRQETAQGLNIQLDETIIYTKEQLIEACNIDTSIWEVESFKTSAWPQKAKGQDAVQLFAVKATFKKIKNLSVARFISKVENNLFEYIPPKNKKKPLKRPSNHCGIINIYDAHIDKMTLLGETEKESDIFKNVAAFESHFENLLEWVENPEFIIFPIGNDFFNVNDARNTTKKGTPQPSYLTHTDAFEIGLNTIINCIDKALEVAPLFVPVVQGNHDEDLATILGIALEKVYRNAKFVEVDNRAIPRKYKRYNNNLFMFDHGDKVKVEKVPLIMQHERPTDYSETQFRYNFRGHCHHSQEYKLTSVKETVGVEVHHLRALSQPSKWNVAAGWVGAQKSTTGFKISACGAMFDKRVLTL